MAVEGYWKNWERNTAWLMREVVFTIIACDPYMKNEDKPKEPRSIFKISDDQEIIEKKKEVKISKAELEAVRQTLLNSLNKK